MNKLAKIIILGTLSVIGFLVFGYLNRLIFLDDLSLTLRIILFILSFMIALGAWGIVAYLIENKRIMLLISLISTLILLIFTPFNIYYLIALLVLLLSLVWSSSKIKREKRARVKIMLDSVVSPSLKSVLTFLCIIVALNYYNFPLSQNTQISIPQKYQEKILSYIIPGFNENLTVDDLVYLIMAKSEGVSVSGDKLDEYIAEKKSQLQPGQFDNYKKQVLEKFKLDNLRLTGNESLKDVKIIENLYKGQFEEYLKKYTGIIQLVSTLSFYFIIAWFWKIFYPLIFLVVWLLFKLFRATGFIEITKEKVEAEKVNL